MSCAWVATAGGVREASGVEGALACSGLTGPVSPWGISERRLLGRAPCAELGEGLRLGFSRA